jgi:hypothetical protein
MEFWVPNMKTEVWLDNAKIVKCKDLTPDVISPLSLFPRMHR